MSNGADSHSSFYGDPSDRCPGDIAVVVVVARFKAEVEVYQTRGVIPVNLWDLADVNDGSVSHTSTSISSGTSRRFSYSSHGPC